MSSIISVKTIKTYPKSFDVITTEIVIPYIREIYEIQYCENNTMEFNENGQIKGVYVRGKLKKFEKHNIEGTTITDSSLEDLYYKICPYFQYENIQGEIKSLIFSDYDLAVKTKKILLEEIEDFYKNYKDYVTTIR